MTWDWDGIVAALRARGKLAELDALERCAHERTIVRVGCNLALAVRDDLTPDVRAGVRASLASEITGCVRRRGRDARDWMDGKGPEIIVADALRDPFAGVIWACALALLEPLPEPRGASQQRHVHPHGAAHDADRWREKGK